MVDFKIDQRRKARREAREAEEHAKQLKERPTIQSQFADLKRGLGELSEHEWESLPEVTNMLGNRVKKPRLEGRSYVVPDSVITGARDSNALESSLASEQMVSLSLSLSLSLSISPACRRCHSSNRH